MDGKYWYLKRCPLLEALTDEEISRLESRSRARTFEAKSQIYMPAETAGAVLLLVSGRVKLYHVTPEGKESILAFIEPGELFGELAALEAGQREEFAETMQTSTVILIPRDEVLRVMQDHPEVVLGLTKLIGLRRRRIERRLKLLLFRSNRQRLTSLLLELAEQYGQRQQDGVLIGIRLSHQELASIIGSTRETVTTLLGELRSEGLLSTSRRRLVLRSVERLASSIGEPSPSISPS